MNQNFPCINGYQLIQNWSTRGNARWSCARKNGKLFFIKEFLAPKYKQLEDGFSSTQVKKSHERCEAFKTVQSELYNRVQAANNGNIISIHDFFVYDCRFYSVTEWVDFASLSITQIAGMPLAQKLVLLKVLSYNIDSLHKHGVIHADLKPENILVKKTSKGYTFKLIDFDASFLRSNPRRGKQISFDFVYVAPETLIATEDESLWLTEKIDIFALGLLFHLYFCGKLPGYPEGYANASSAVSDDVSLRVDKRIPEWMKILILRMTDKDPKQRPDAETVFRILTTQDCSLMPNRLHPPERYTRTR